MSEQVKLIVERRWTDDEDGACDPVAFTEAESAWLTAESADALGTNILGLFARKLIARTRVEDE